jgi:hypothetical protein
LIFNKDNWENHRFQVCQYEVTKQAVNYKLNLFNGPNINSGRIIHFEISLCNLMWATKHRGFYIVLWVSVHARWFIASRPLNLRHMSSKLVRPFVITNEFGWVESMMATSMNPLIHRLETKHESPSPSKQNG